MNLFDSIVRRWQKAPLRWRTSFAASPLSIPVRRLINRVRPNQLDVFDLQAPLSGHRFRLHWQTQKGFVFGTWEPEVTEILQRTVQRGWTVVDIGAHIGYHTLLLAKLVGPQGKVFAFEPMLENSQVLNENIALNGYKNVVVVNKAVTDRSCTVTMTRNDDQLLSRTSSIARESGGDVEGVSLDHFFLNSPDPVAFVKMDAEGAEAAVLEGMRHILERDRPLLLIELHGFNTVGLEHPALDRLQKADYSFDFMNQYAEAHILAKPKT